MATIYKIWSEKGEKVYIGSTTQRILQRWPSHKTPSNSASSKELIDAELLFVATQFIGIG